MKRLAVLLALAYVAQAATVTIPAGATSAQIQTIINATGVGDTVAFPVGTYQINSIVTFLSSRNYQASPGCVLNGAGYLVQLEYNNAHDVTVNGFTFNGGGLLSNGSDATHPANNLKITNNGFQNIIQAGNYAADAIHSWTGTRNSLIQGNTFKNIYDAGHVNGWSEVCGAIWLFDPTTTTIDSNTFTSTCQPIHETLRQNSAGGLKVTNNTMHLTARYNVEIQGPWSANDVIVSGNYIDTPQPGINGQAGISVAIGGTGHQILNNSLQGPNQGKPSNQSDAIEAMGTGFLIQSNIAGHWGQAQLIGYSDATWQTKNNTWCDMTYPAPLNIIQLDTGGQNPAVNINNPYTASCAGVTFPPPATTPPVPPTPVPPQPVVLNFNCPAVSGKVQAGATITITCVIQ